MIVSVKGNMSHYLPLVLKGMDLCFQNSQYKYIDHHKQIPVRLYQKNTSDCPNTFGPGADDFLHQTYDSILMGKELIMQD